MKKIEKINSTRQHNIRRIVGIPFERPFSNR